MPEELLAQSFSTESLIMWGGVILIIIAVFIETGLLIGLIVPGGETLLFSAGLLTATDVISIKIHLLILICFIAALLGDNLGYYIGYKTGNNIYNWKENFFYKKKYLKQGASFYKENGKWAITFGRFLPIIRTFNPLISGVTRLNWGEFFLFTFIGSALYITSLLLAGYFLGQQFPQIQNYIEFVFLGVVTLVLIPLIKQLIKDNRKS